MANMHCALCDSEMDTVEFDLQKSSTLYSKTSLFLLLQSCFVEQFHITSFGICKMCYILLNELDVIKLRAKGIVDQLKKYMNKYFINSKASKSESLDIIIVNETEESAEASKKINSKILKSHLKIHHSELNDIETNFDFDEVGSISDISPSLEDLNMLNGIETEKSCKKIEDSEADVQKNTKKTRKKDVINPKLYECVECSKTWKTAAELKSHMSSHNKERPYICEICGQAYKRQQALAIHVGMHNGVNPFTCVYCNKSFTQKGALVRHTPIHTGELPFQCDLCGKRFVHHTSFNMHKLSHTGQKLYKCEICGLSLMSGSHLKRHMRVHTGEKKYECNTCGKKFAERYNLVVHEKLHLGVSKSKKYQCQICDNFYNRKVKLEEHLLTAHQKIKTPVD